MKIKKFLALSTAFAIGFSNSQVAVAQEMPGDSEPEYLEYHYQVNFDDLDVFVVNGATFDIASNGGQEMDAETAEAVDALMASLSECSEIEEQIVAMLNDNQQLAAISFTEAPLLLKDGHYERIKTADAGNYADSDKNGDGKFTLYTSVYRNVKSLDEHGNYEYTTTTYGAWSENSFLGGHDYPDSGEDYILQSTPNTWTRTSHCVIAYYDNSPVLGVEGEDYHISSGNTNYLQCAIQDDPYDFAKARQNTSFTMTCTSTGDHTTLTRMINSYYVHTWAEMSIGVSILASSKKEISLSVTPQIQEKSWNVYNYVSFDF